jgi:hypothetical protein
MKGSSWTGLRSAFRALASRPEGVTNRELVAEGYAISQVVNNMLSLTKDGEVVAVGFRSERRYFTSQEAANHYESTALPLIKAAKAKARSERRRVPKVEKPPKLDAAPEPPNPQGIKPEPSVKFGQPKAGINIPKYTGPKWAADTPAIKPAQRRGAASAGPSRIRRTVQLGARREGRRRVLAHPARGNSHGWRMSRIAAAVALLALLSAGAIVCMVSL